MATGPHSICKLVVQYIENRRGRLGRRCTETFPSRPAGEPRAIWCSGGTVSTARNKHNGILYRSMLLHLQVRGTVFSIRKEWDRQEMSEGVSSRARLPPIANLGAYRNYWNTWRELFLEQKRKEAANWLIGWQFSFPHKRVIIAYHIPSEL